MFCSLCQTPYLGAGGLLAPGAQSCPFAPLLKSVVGSRVLSQGVTNHWGARAAAPGEVEVGVQGG